MISNSDWTSAVVLSSMCITSLSIGITAWLWKQGKAKSEVHPEKWVLVGNIRSLIIYPIKSCQGVQVQEAVLTNLGLKFREHNMRDRDFMVVDSKGKNVTMTQNPKMALINLSLDKPNMITLTAPGMESITFSYPDKNNNSTERLGKVKHDSKIKSLDCGDEVAKWFEKYLDKEGARVYYHHLNKSQRTFEPYHYQCPQFKKSDLGAFHNETSYLMVSQESIDELNARLTKDSSWKNWRPTILIDNVAEPFAEVNWSFIRVGRENALLKASVPCTRCALTTVDPDKGILPRDGEPLKTLRAMNKTDVFFDRKIAEMMKNQGIMGSRLGLYPPVGEGMVVKVGDPVYAALL